MLAVHFQKLGPRQFRRSLADLVVRIIPDDNLKRLRDIIDVMDSASKEILRLKSGAPLEGAAEGKDVMSILCTF